MSPQTSYIFTVSKLTSLKILGGRQHRATPAGQILGVTTPAGLTPMALRCRTSWCLVLSLLLRTREAGLYWKVDLLDCRRPSWKHSGFFNRNAAQAKSLSCPSRHLAPVSPASVRWHISKNHTSQNFYACYLWPCRGLLLTALQCDMDFTFFVDDVT